MRNPKGFMRPLTLGASLAAAVLLTPVLAQAQDEAAAARLPNAFDAPTPAARRAAQPQPASEAPDIVRGRETLLAIIEDAQDGTLDFSVFSEDVANRLRPAEAELTAAIQSFGTVEEIAYVGHQDGRDLFAIRFDKTVTQWMIGFDADDRLGVFLFREAPAEEPAAGQDAAPEPDAAPASTSPE